MEGGGVIALASASSELDDHALAHEGRTVCRMSAE
jgi:hypothetical protein